MGMFNRLLDVDGTQPIGWGGRTPPSNPSIDWHKWKIGVKPLADALLLLAEGDINSAQLAALFDLSATEQTQLTEMYSNFISAAVQGHAANSVEARRVNIARYAAIMGAVERKQPDQFGVDMSTNTWLYNKLGITTTTDDR